MIPDSHNPNYDRRASDSHPYSGPPILQSSNPLLPTIDEAELDLTHYLDILLRRRWIVLAVFLTVAVTTAIVTFNTQPVYQASAFLNIEKEKSGNNIIQANAMVDRGNDDYYQTQYKLLKSESLIKKVYETLKLSEFPDFAGGPDSLNEAVTISPVPRSRLVYIKAESHDRELSAKIANTLSNAFIEQNLSNQLFIAKEILQALQLRQDDTGSRSTLESLPAVVNNPLVQQLKKNQAEVEADYANISNRYTEKHPDLVALRARMSTLRSQIEIETNKIIQSLKLDLSGQLMGNNIRLVDEAQVPLSPIKPKKKLNILLGIIAGFVLGFAVAMAVEFLDQSIRTQEDVENKLKLPFLSTVPFSAQSRSKKVYLSLLSKEQSLTSEAFRNMRTMVDFSGVSGKMDTLLVTSSVKEEGKSYVCINLAVAYAGLGEKVIVIDGDLRRPKVHKLFALSTAKGVSDYLARGQSVEELSQLVQKSDVPNLDVITCGPRPPNPSPSTGLIVVESTAEASRYAP